MEKYTVRQIVTEKAGEAKLTSDKINFKSKMVTRDKRILCIRKTFDIAK
jgi:hypothetical protein